LKPHNIFVKPDGNIKVTDFDYKTIFDKKKYPKHRYGSVYFVSPEVIDNCHNEDCLVWNCGAISYLLFSGKQIHQVYGFQNYQDVSRENPIELEIPEFDEMSEEFMDLLEHMLHEDQFLRWSFVE
jgi:serine/threonine protein kinase